MKHVAAQVVDPLTDLEFGIAEQVGVVLAGPELGQPPGLGVKAVAAAGVHGVGAGLLLGRERSIVPGAGFLARAHFGVLDHDLPF
jgi:hypothetical protein